MPQSPWPWHISAVLGARTRELFAFALSILKYFGQQEYQQRQPIRHHIKAHQPRSAIGTEVSIKHLSLAKMTNIFVCKGTIFFIKLKIIITMVMFPYSALNFKRIFRLVKFVFKWFILF